MNAHNENNVKTMCQKAKLCLGPRQKQNYCFTVMKKEMHTFLVKTGHCAGVFAEYHETIFETHMGKQNIWIFHHRHSWR